VLSLFGAAQRRKASNNKNQIVELVGGFNGTFNWDIAHVQKQFEL
jgi:hypothetical protein